MIKGGYKIVNFNGAALSGTAVELSGIYDQIVDDYDKPIMVSGVTISGKLQDDTYADVQEKTAQDLSKSVELNVYGGVITVTEDDEVTFVSAMSNAELTEELNALGSEMITSTDELIATVTSNIKSVQFDSTFNMQHFGINAGSYGLIYGSGDRIEVVSFTLGSMLRGRYNKASGEWAARFVTAMTAYTPA